MVGGKFAKKTPWTGELVVFESSDTNLYEAMSFQLYYSSAILAALFEPQFEKSEANVQRLPCLLDSMLAYYCFSRTFVHTLLLFHQTILVLMAYLYFVLSLLRHRRISSKSSSLTATPREAMWLEVSAKVVLRLL